MPRAVEQEQKETRDAGLTVADYFRRIETGEIDEDAPVELWDGQIVAKISKNLSHEIALMELLKRLLRIVPAGMHVSTQSPITLGANKSAGTPPDDRSRRTTRLCESSACRQ